MIREPLFRGALAHPSTLYVPLRIHDGVIGTYIGWKDATSSATLTLELTSINDAVASDTSPTAWHWRDSGLAITGPVGSAAGATLLNVENVRQARARLKIVTAANCDFEIMDGAMP